MKKETRRRRREQSAAHARRRAQGARARVRLALSLAAIANVACYSYVPVSFASAASTKEDVRVRVTEDAAARLTTEIGTFSRELDGQIAQAGGDSVSLGVTVDRMYRGTTIGTSTQSLVLARSEIMEVRRREFSRKRTVLVSIGTVVGFGVLAAGIVQLVDPNGAPENQNTPPPPPANRRPSGAQLRFRIPVP